MPRYIDNPWEAFATAIIISAVNDARGKSGEAHRLKAVGWIQKSNQFTFLCQSLDIDPYLLIAWVKNGCPSQRKSAIMRTVIESDSLKEMKKREPSSPQKEAYR